MTHLLTRWITHTQERDPQFMADLHADGWRPAKNAFTRPTPHDKYSVLMVKEIEDV